MNKHYINLHAYSEYSLGVGFFDLNDYIKLCYQRGFNASVITEKFNLFSSIKFYKNCIDFGMKPIIGCELILEDEYDEYISFSRFILLCKNRNGYINLISLLSKAYLQNLKNGIPIIKRKWLATECNDLIAIGLSFESDIGKFLLKNSFLEVKTLFDFWIRSFGCDYYLSITKFGSILEKKYLSNLLKLDFINKIQLVITNEISYLRKDDFISYKSKIISFDNIYDNLSDEIIQNKYFKTNDEIYNTFSDVFSAITNSYEIVKKCNLVLNFGYNFSPKFHFLSIKESGYILNKHIIKDFFLKIFSENLYMTNVYINRLKLELDVIIKIGFSNYFLITFDFIFWAKSRNISVGPGRGSAGGSMIAYMLMITEVDSIKYNLLFERFLNKNRITNPDFDIDFCIEGRDLVIDYIFEFYGKNKVAQIITFGCMTVKSAIRDVGRAFGYSYGFVDRIIKLISNDFGISLKSELINNNDLRKEYNESYDVQVIINNSIKLENVIKGSGKHAGGLVIACVNLIEHMPIHYEKLDSQFITQLDKYDAESMGFVKFDFLGLKTLTLLSNTIDSLLSYSIFNDNIKLDLNILDFKDQITFDLFSNGDTLGVFQFESEGIRSIIQKVKPDRFGDIVALVALYRPGPMQSGLMMSFINKKTGVEIIDYIHIRLRPILRETYGVIVYQEQVMLIAQIFASYDLSSADILRSAMSKKDKENMKKNLEIFIDGARLNYISKKDAEDVFYLLEKFAGYGFNKAHSVVYAILAYNCAWLKSNYNIFFLASLLSSDMDNNDKSLLYLKDTIKFGIKINNPDINRSFYCFVINNTKFLSYGFGAIKGLGRSVISDIISIRTQYGYYTNFFDFLYRININLLTKKTIQTLIYSGCFDNLCNSRFKLILIGNKIFDFFSKTTNINIYFYGSFIENFFNYSIRNFYYILEYKSVEIKNEIETLGILLSFNPITFYKNEIYEIVSLSYKSGLYFNKFLCGLILWYSFKSKVKDYGIINIQSDNNIIDVLISHYRLKYLKNIIKKGKFIVLCFYEYKNQLYEILLEDFFLFRFFFVKYIDIYIEKNYFSDKFLNFFYTTLSYKLVKGYTVLRINIITKNGSIVFTPFLNIPIGLHEDLLNKLKNIKEIKKIKSTYIF
jgi:DNA polymerase III subunit alpha